MIDPDLYQWFPTKFTDPENYEWTRYEQLAGCQSVIYHRHHNVTVIRHFDMSYDGLFEVCRIIKPRGLCARYKTICDGNSVDDAGTVTDSIKSLHEELKAELFKSLGLASLCLIVATTPSMQEVTRRMAVALDLRS